MEPFYSGLSLSPPMERSELEKIMRLGVLSVCVPVCLSVCVHELARYAL